MNRLTGSRTHAASGASVASKPPTGLLEEPTRELHRPGDWKNPARAAQSTSRLDGVRGRQEERREWADRRIPHEQHSGEQRYLEVQRDVEEDISRATVIGTGTQA
jgi:hypothetical protein